MILDLILFLNAKGVTSLGNQNNILRSLLVSFFIIEQSKISRAIKLYRIRGGLILGILILGNILL